LPMGIFNRRTSTKINLARAQSIPTRKLKHQKSFTIFHALNGFSGRALTKEYNNFKAAH